MKSSDRAFLKPYIVRARFGSFWKYATRRYRMEPLGLGGSVQSAVWSYHRRAARRFATRAQAKKWVRWYARWLHQVEIVKVPIGPLEDRIDEILTQGRLFE
jgi:hypothetical protein